jgi:hypothetical protein
MAWEWVAPTATALTGATGVFFTWLTGVQGRAQLDQQSRRTEESAERSRVLKEQRDAYLTVLYYAELEVRRARYEREGKREKLLEVEAKWPKGERVRIYTEATIAVEAFGSQKMRGIIATWREAADTDAEDRMRGFYKAFVEQARREIGSDRPSPPSDP